jgi:hypothetical protein
MARKYGSTRHIEDMTQAELSAAIRYLDPQLRRETEPNDHTGFAICLALWILMVGFLLFIWLYPY